MDLKFGLPVTSIEKMSMLFAEYPQIKQVILYGSRAKGNYRPGSDIDLTIIGSLNSEELLSLENELDDLLLPQTIDISLYSKIDNEALKDHIQRIGLIFYQKQDAIADTPRSL